MMSGSPDRSRGGEIIVEFCHLGNATRVAAVDVETMVEIVFQVPAKTPQEMIVVLARRKLEYRLGRAGKLAAGPQIH